MPRTPQDQGRDFEKEFAAELGLEVVPGSGAIWNSKLDVQGQGLRWSLKFTSKDSITLSRSLLDEAVRACEGFAGDGATPMLGIRLRDPEYDMVVMRKNDFLRLAAGEIVLTARGNSKREERKKRASTPVLLRDEQA